MKKKKDEPAQYIGKFENHTVDCDSDEIFMELIDTIIKNLSVKSCVINIVKVGNLNKYKIEVTKVCK